MRYLLIAVMFLGMLGCTSAPSKVDSEEYIWKLQTTNTYSLTVPSSWYCSPQENPSKSAPDVPLVIVCVKSDAPPAFAKDK